MRVDLVVVLRAVLSAENLANPQNHEAKQCHDTGATLDSTKPALRAMHSSSDLLPVVAAEPCQLSPGGKQAFVRLFDVELEHSHPEASKEGSTRLKLAALTEYSGQLAPLMANQLFRGVRAYAAQAAPGSSASRPGASRDSPSRQAPRIEVPSAGDPRAECCRFTIPQFADPVDYSPYAQQKKTGYCKY